MDFNINKVFETMKAEEEAKRKNIIHAFILKNNILVESQGGYFIKEYFDDRAAGMEFLKLTVGDSLPEDGEFREIERHDWMCAHMEAMGIKGFMFFEHDSTHNKLELLAANKNKTLAEKVREIISWPEFESMKKVDYDATSWCDGFRGLEIYYIKPESGDRGLYTIEWPEFEPFNEYFSWEF